LDVFGAQAILAYFLLGKILQTTVVHTGHLPFIMRLPFAFIVSSPPFISTFFLHLTQNASIKNHLKHDFSLKIGSSLYKSCPLNDN